MAKLALAIMMKDEAEIIERCLSSITGLADRVILLDTGSTDTTIFKAATFLQNNKITFRLYREKFVDFAHGRTRLLELAKAEKDIDYVLMLDADEIISLSDTPTTIKDNLISPIYDIDMMAGPVGYNLPRLTSNKISVEYKGVTHEFMETGSYQTVYFPSIKIVQINDSFRRKSNQKHKNDIELLENALKDCNDDKLKARYTFYLAQAYYSDNQLIKAKEHYDKRTLLGGWKEEIFYSYYCLGLIAEAQNYPDKVFYYHWMAYNYCPTRLESIAALKRYCDKRGLSAISENVLIPIFKATPHPNTGLFLENHLYYAYK